MELRFHRALFAAGCFALISCGPPAQTAPTLGPRAIYNTDPQPGPLAVRDMDGDGKLDAVVGLTGSTVAGIDILYGDGLGGFAQPVRLEGTTQPVNALAVIDVNKDGRGDIVAADDHTVFLHNGGRQFSAAVAGTADTTLNNYRPGAMRAFGTAGDSAVVAVQLYQGFPAMGDQLVTVRADANGVLSTGAFRFDFTRDVKVDGIEVEDFDGDGVTDVVAVANTADSLQAGRVYFFSGANLSQAPRVLMNQFHLQYPQLGTTPYRSSVSTTATSTPRLPLLQLVNTRDGEQWDLVILDLKDNKLETLARRQRVPYEGIAMGAGKFNGDTREDIAIAVIDGNVQYYTRTSNAVIDFRVDNYNSSFVPMTLSAFAVADLNNDSLSDIVYVNRSAAKLELRLTGGTTAPAQDASVTADVPTATDGGIDAGSIGDADTDAGSNGDADTDAGSNADTGSSADAGTPDA